LLGGKESDERECGKAEREEEKGKEEREKERGRRERSGEERNLGLRVSPKKGKFYSPKKIPCNSPI
jgi:hypothetical protein